MGECTEAAIHEPKSLILDRQVPSDSLCLYNLQAEGDTRLVQRSLYGATQGLELPDAQL